MNALDFNQETHFYSAEELLAISLDEVPKLWSPFFPRKGLVGLTGSSDCGKSTLLRQLAITIALQEETFLGFPLHHRRASAIVVCTEDEMEGIAAMLGKHLKGRAKEGVENLLFVFESDELIQKLDEQMCKRKPDLVVLDVWSDTYADNPNSWSDVRQNLKVLKTLASKHDCLIAIVHHTVKNSEKSLADKNKVNGSQAIEAKLRCVMELRNADNPKHRELRVLKNNYMSREAKAEGILLELDTETMLFSNTGEKLSLAGTIETGSRVYDVNLWIQRMADCRAEGLSFSKARELLAEQYPDQEVPGKTWFVQHCKPHNRSDNQ
jgi:hypothetical protein